MKQRNGFYDHLIFWSNAVEAGGFWCPLVLEICDLILVGQPCPDKLCSREFVLVDIFRKLFTWIFALHSKWVAGGNDAKVNLQQVACRGSKEPDDLKWFEGLSKQSGFWKCNFSSCDLNVGRQQRFCCVKDEEQDVPQNPGNTNSNPTLFFSLMHELKGMHCTQSTHTQQKWSDEVISPASLFSCDIVVADPHAKIMRGEWIER